MAIVLQLSTAATADGEVDATLQKASTDLKITNRLALMYSLCLPLLNFGKEANKNASAHSTLQLIKDKGLEGTMGTGMFAGVLPEVQKWQAWTVHHCNVVGEVVAYGGNMVSDPPYYGSSDF
ncbi:hypothetical protein TYRP_017242 [Tyrophagus putrescentiae]|nr:hypothetical protein TYRP_017242 [Tyrophagus putrescentiae]